MDTWEHLEIELEVLLWICFSWRTVFWIFEEKIFSTFFLEFFVGLQKISSNFQRDFLIHSTRVVVWISIEILLNYLFSKWRDFFCESPKNISNFFWKTKFLLRAKSIVSALELPFQNTVKHQKRTKTRKVILKKPRGGR